MFLSTCTTDDCWEQLSSSKSSSTILDQQRRHINNNNSGGQNGSRHQADVAIFSVSALQNVNVKQSVTWWLTNALSSSIQRHL
uniref:Uncharacterized protein n=1 Tax=Globodera pallida TaxID=36090 RepID=A0A183CDW6_GLOPA